MPKICYRPQQFYAKSLERLEWINQILHDFAARGFKASVRQILYQFVSHKWAGDACLGARPVARPGLGIESTKKENYNALQNLIDNGRMAGLIDWELIEDRNREVVRPSTWDSPAEILEAAAESYQRDPWQSQPCLVEVVIEKAALVGIIEDICAEYRVPYLAARGYNSQSIAWEQGHKSFRVETREIVVLYLGDHDPSGINMSRELKDRFELFAKRKIDFRRLALNWDQTRELTPNDAKEGDTRFAQYVKEFGTEECWELDALDPDVIVELLRTEIESLIDPTAWGEEMELERKERARLRRIAKRERDGS